MKKNLFLLFMLLYFGVGFSQNISPTILSTAGETFQSNTIQLDWTIGELAISSLQNSDIQITQGFHQPFYIISTIDKLPSTIGQIKLFPNPTADYLSIDISFETYSTFLIQLFDANGKIIWKKTKEGTAIKDNISLSDLPNGSYFLNFIIDKNLYSKTFTIQKIK